MTTLQLRQLQRKHKVRTYPWVSSRTDLPRAMNNQPGQSEKVQKATDHCDLNGLKGTSKTKRWDQKKRTNTEDLINNWIWASTAIKAHIIFLAVPPHQVGCLCNLVNTSSNSQRRGTTSLFLHQIKWPNSRKICSPEQSYARYNNENQYSF